MSLLIHIAFLFCCHTIAWVQVPDSYDRKDVSNLIP